MEEKLKRIVKFSTAYDKRHSDPQKNYGIGSVKCWMVLKGEKGAVQFMFNTGIYLPHIVEEYKKQGIDLSPAEGWDVGYHSPNPRYEGQLEYDCEFTNTGKCYYDGSSLLAEKWFEIFVREGDEKIWEMLEDKYRGLFLSKEEIK